ncbi:head maturation protease, ClpP-related [Paenibacillus senegalensis]|uniref:head maturation protease, ClpP-related n=1 Tax=Paenibacillus senegalensis TaxID=1465766 RepID=UPI0002886078|nr:head maturation protease, ClpP-related [Paenibacillus senegalensis]
MTKLDFLKTFKNQAYLPQLEKIDRKLESRYNEADDVTEITIYGVIGYAWRESVSASEIDDILKDAKGDLLIHLNSPGGDAFDGIAIYNRLKKHKGKVTIHVDGWACSAASVIAMAADELIMGLGSMVMIHEASNIVWGTKTQMRKEADVLDELEEGIIDIYMTKAKVSREDIRAAVDAETWYSAQKAVDIGFANAVAGNSDDEKENEIAALRTQLADAHNEIQQLKNKKEPEPDPAPAAPATRFFF